MSDQAEKLCNEREAASRKLEHAEAVYQFSRKGGADGVRPIHKTGFLGLAGPKVDSIEFWTNKIHELTPQLEEERKVVAADAKEDAALVFFNDRRAAAEAAQVNSCFLVVSDCFDIRKCTNVSSLICYFVLHQS